MNLPAKSGLVKFPKPIFGVMERADGSEVVIAGLKVLVVGLGSTGLSVSTFLAKNGAVVTATDLRIESEIEGLGALSELGVVVEAGGHELSSIEGIELLVVSPGVPSDIPLLKEAHYRGIEVVSEIELASRFISEPVIAVAGTNGKTTTATLIGEMLENADKKTFVGGNIGTPLIEYVAGGERADVCVIEVSSFQLEEVDSLRPHVAVLLNITEDHLDRYKDFDDYAETKLNLFGFQEGSDYAVVNASDPAVSERVHVAALKARLVPFALAGRTAVGDGSFFEDGELVLRLRGAEERYNAKHISTVTSLDNAMAAVAAARIAGADRASVQRTLDTFASLPHRMERVGEFEGVTYINDSKGTNVGAARKALESVDGPVVMVAGGVDKGGDYSVLAALVREKVRLMMVTGPAAEKISRALANDTECIKAKNFEAAVREAASKAKAGETVLLSPACSSFDEFGSYAERGERFREIVEGLW